MCRPFVARLVGSDAAGKFVITAASELVFHNMVDCEFSQLLT
jgi:hypothetical protein